MIYFFRKLKISFGGICLFLKIEGSVPEENNEAPPGHVGQACSSDVWPRQVRSCWSPWMLTVAVFWQTFKAGMGDPYSLSWKIMGSVHWPWIGFPKENVRHMAQSVWVYLKVWDFEGYWNESYSWAGGTLISIKNQGFVCFQRIVTQIRFKSYVAMIDWMCRGWMWADHQSSGR